MFSLPFFSQVIMLSGYVMIYKFIVLFVLIEGAIVVMIIWVYNYLSSLKLWVWIQLMARCTRHNIMWLSLSVTCDRSVVFSSYSSFLHQWNWPPRYSCNIIESGIKHHKPCTIRISSGSTHLISGVRVSVMVFNVTFNNISIWFHKYAF
jgi:hypothetical protein